jgi:UDP-N-acetyl-D-galactosamine dehydrogenase
MGAYVVDRVMRLMLGRGLPVGGARVLVMGLAFKENCPDLRNSRAIDVVRGFADLHAAVEVWDPWVDRDEARRAYGLEPLAGAPQAGVYDAIVVTVAHRDFAALGAEAVRRFGRPGAVLFDVKGVFGKADSDGRL